jgi:hypothetical protein
MSQRGGFRAVLGREHDYWIKGQNQNFGRKEGKNEVEEME